MNKSESQNHSSQSHSCDTITAKNYLNFNIISWNCNSIRHKTELIKLFLEQEKPEIFMLNEKKVDEKSANELLNGIIPF